MRPALRWTGVLLCAARRVEMQVAPEAIAPLFTAVQAACEADAAGQCVVMASQLEMALRPGGAVFDGMQTVTGRC